MKPIFLIGFMGCGKTTLGRALALTPSGGGAFEAPAPLRFVDLDEALEQRYRMSVAQMFDCHGESWFRARESEMLAELCKSSDTVIACGGGTPCRSENLDLMLANGIVVWLQAPLEVLCRRLSEAGDTRPLLRGLDAEGLRDFVSERLAARRPFYGRAHIVFDSSRLESPAEISESVAKFFRLPIFHQ